GDAIDFAHAVVTNAVVTGGTTLTVTFSGGQTQNFTLAAPLPTGDFVQTTIDGAGGTKVVVTNATLPPPPIYTWLDCTIAEWATAGDWSGGVIPDGTTDATISGSGTETVTVSTNQSVNVLTLDDVNATVAVTNGGTLSAFGGIVDNAVHEIDITQGT